MAENVRGKEADKNDAKHIAEERREHDGQPQR
jgi:hypothetical protein